MLYASTCGVCVFVCVCVCVCVCVSGCVGRWVGRWVCVMITYLATQNEYFVFNTTRIVRILLYLQDTQNFIGCNTGRCDVQLSSSIL